MKSGKYRIQEYIYANPKTNEPIYNTKDIPFVPLKNITKDKKYLQFNSKVVEYCKTNGGTITETQIVRQSGLCSSSNELANCKRTAQLTYWSDEKCNENTENTNFCNLTKGYDHPQEMKVNNKNAIKLTTDSPNTASTNATGSISADTVNKVNIMQNNVDEFNRKIPVGTSSIWGENNGWTVTNENVTNPAKIECSGANPPIENEPWYKGEKTTYDLFQNQQKLKKKMAINELALIGGKYLWVDENNNLTLKEYNIGTSESTLKQDEGWWYITTKKTQVGNHPVYLYTIQWGSQQGSYLNGGAFLNENNSIDLAALGPNPSTLDKHILIPYETGKNDPWKYAWKLTNTDASGYTKLIQSIFNHDKFCKQETDENGKSVTQAFKKPDCLTCSSAMKLLEEYEKAGSFSAMKKNSSFRDDLIDADNIYNYQKANNIPVGDYNTIVSPYVVTSPMFGTGGTCDNYTTPVKATSIPNWPYPASSPAPTSNKSGYGNPPDRCNKQYCPAGCTHGIECNITLEKVNQTSSHPTTLERCINNKMQNQPLLNAFKDALKKRIAQDLDIDATLIEIIILSLTTTFIIKVANVAEKPKWINKIPKVGATQTPKIISMSNKQNIYFNEINNMFQYTWGHNTIRNLHRDPTSDLYIDMIDCHCPPNIQNDGQPGLKKFNNKYFLGNQQYPGKWGIHTVDNEPARPDLCTPNGKGQQCWNQLYRSIIHTCQCVNEQGHSTHCDWITKKGGEPVFELDTRKTILNFPNWEAPDKQNYPILNPNPTNKKAVEIKNLNLPIVPNQGITGQDGCGGYRCFPNNADGSQSQTPQNIKAGHEAKIIPSNLYLRYNPQTDNLTLDAGPVDANSRPSKINGTPEPADPDIPDTIEVNTDISYKNNMVWKFIPDTNTEVYQGKVVNPQSSSSSSSSSSSDNTILSKIPLWAIILICVVVVGLIIGVVFLARFLRRKKKAKAALANQQPQQKSQPQPQQKSQQNAK